MIDILNSTHYRPSKLDGSSIICKIQQILAERSEGDPNYLKQSIEECALLIGLTVEEWKAAAKGKPVFKNLSDFSKLLILYQNITLKGGL